MKQRSGLGARPRRLFGRTRLPRTVSGALLTGALVVAGCGQSGGTGTDVGSGTTPKATVNATGGLVLGPADQPSVDGGKITFGIEAEPEGLDPTRYDFSQAGNAVASAVFDPLATLDEKGQAVPYLATGFEHSADFKTWTIGIPTGVTFHDGSVLDAAVVAQDLLAYQSSLIIGPSMKSWFDTATAPDPTHVIVTTTVPLRSLPSALATQIGYVFAPSMLTDTDLAKKPVGSGPFVFASHDDGIQWTFKRNPNYRIKGLPHLDAIEFDPIADDGARNQKLRKGDIDMLETLGGPEIAELRAAASQFKVVENQNGDKAFLMLNTTKPPFDSLTARTAVASATDSATWRKEIYDDVARPVTSPFGEGQLGYLADNGYPMFDMDKAKALVAQYKRESGQDLEFTFLTSADLGNARSAQQLVPRFEEAGMKVTVAQKPQINQLAEVATGEYQMSQFRLFSNPDPAVDSIFYSTKAISPISLNFPRYSNPEVDDLALAAAGPLDEHQRDQNLRKVSRILAQQVPFIWLGQMTWMVAGNINVNGLAGAVNGTVPTITPKTWIAGLSISR